jgi:hypothetical protein
VGDSLEREDGRVGKRGHESEFHVVVLQDFVLVLGAHLRQRRHVDLVEGRRRCCGVLRLFQAPGDAQVNAVHLYVCLFPPSLSNGSGSRGWFSIGWDARGGRRFDPVLGESCASFRFAYDDGGGMLLCFRLPGRQHVCIFGSDVVFEH